MLILFILFAAFLWGLAKAPREVTQALLALAWVVMAAGCVASVGAAIFM